MPHRRTLPSHSKPIGSAKRYSWLFDWPGVCKYFQSRQEEFGSLLQRMDTSLQRPAKADGLSSIQPFVHLACRGPAYFRTTIMWLILQEVSQFRIERNILSRQASDTCHRDENSGSQIRRLGTSPTETPTKQKETWASIFYSRSQSLLPILSHNLRGRFYFHPTFI